MPLNLSVPEMTELQPRISVIGVGGAGGNAVNNMIESSLEGVEFMVANTDAQALGLSKADKRIQLGANRTQGLGAGSLPEVGREAAEESLEEILEYVGNSHMLFITAGMGGGTGTGAAPVIAKAAKEKGILAVGVVTKPFHFEGARRMKIASAGIEELQDHVDTLIIIPNQNLFSIADERTTFHEAFALADQVLHSGVRGITDLMVMPGLINLDFNDVRTVMSEMGKAMMGTGEATGDKRAIEAAEAAISNPLLDEVSMKGARGVLINITGSMDMTLFEVDEAANRIRAEVDPDANIIVGSTFNQDLEGKVRVSVVATGIDTAIKDKRLSDNRVAASQAPKPWREPAPMTVQPAAVHQPVLQPAQQPVSTPVRQPLHPQTPPHVDPAPSQPIANAANPVGDVHERIKRLLTEDSAPVDRARMPAPRVASPTENGINPFRGAQSLGKSSLDAAVGMIKTIGAGKKDQISAENSAQEPAPGPVVREDLFDDEEDAELEIPSFLRKKKVS